MSGLKAKLVWPVIAAVAASALAVTGVVADRPAAGDDQGIPLAEGQADYPPIVRGFVRGLAVDGVGNRYVVGTFSGSAVDFDPTLGTDEKSSAGGDDVCVTRFNADGSYAWTQTFGGSGDDHGYRLVVEKGVVYVTGDFSGSDAGVGGPGSISSAGGSDCFVLALNARDGSPRTDFGCGGVQTFGGSLDEEAYGIAVREEVVYAAGDFHSSDAGIGGTGTVSSGGHSDCFVLALDLDDGSADTSFSSDGVQTFGGSGHDWGEYLAFDGDVMYVVGAMTSSDAGFGGTGSVGSAGDHDCFVLALDLPFGSPRTQFSGDGVQTFGGSADDRGHCVAILGGTLYVAGVLSSSEAGVGGTGSTGSCGGGDCFVLALSGSDGSADTSFSSDGVQTFGGSGDDHGRHIVAHGSAVYVAGSFASSDAGIGGTGSVASAGGNDCFVASLNVSDGGARTVFGGDGVQTFGGSAEDRGHGVVCAYGMLQLAGSCASSDAQLNGTGPSYDGSAWLGFLLELDPIKTIVYVDADAGGANDGTSWANAYTDLQDALGAAANGDEIWVAEGTYKPTDDTNRSTCFQLVAGVGVYGGFAGTEANREDRDPESNVTVLSGDIGTVDDAGDNSYTVVRGALGAALDGFTVTRGRADDGSAGDVTNCGGGLVVPADMVVVRCIFSSNTATRRGGAVWIEWNADATLSISDCTFTGNEVNGVDEAFGGAVAANEDDILVIIDCAFTGNQVATSGDGYGEGGAISTRGGALMLEYCSFESNSAEDEGGAVGIDDWGGSGQSIVMTGCSFTSNGAEHGGAITLWGYSGPPAELSDCRFTGNQARTGGAIDIDERHAVLSACTFVNNDADERGGAITVEDESELTITDSMFEGNSAGEWGGAIGGREADRIALSGCRFEANISGDDGGAVASNDGGLTATDCTFDSNSAADSGGAIEFDEGAVSLSGCTFRNNTALDNGGAVSCDECWDSASITDCAFENNSARHAGAMELDEGEALIEGCTFTCNHADDSCGALGMHDGGGTLRHCSFTGNTSGLAGGAAIIESDLLMEYCLFEANTSKVGGAVISEDGEFRHCRFTGNEAEWDGGAVFMIDPSDPVIKSCFFDANTAGKLGGAIHARDYALPEISGSVFTGNSAGQAGGGVYAWGGCRLKVGGCTFTGNSAGSEGGGLCCEERSDAAVKGCIFRSNTASSGAQIAAYRSEVIVTYSCVEGGWSGPGGTGNITDDPLFVDAGSPLGPDGEPGTADDGLRLKSTSPCLDTGTALTVAEDLRGVARPQGNGWEMGAYEGAVSADGAMHLVWPEGTIEDCDPAYQWTDVTGATKYHLWVSSLSGGGVVINDSNVTSSSPYAAGVELTQGQSYRWWMRAYVGGAWGAWSSPKDFTVKVQTPVQLGPLTDTVNTSPEFSWTDTGADGYHLWVNDVTTWVNVVNESGLVGTTHTAGAPLVAGHTYKWWIRSQKGGVWSAWSEAVTFGVLVPGTPTLVAPGATTSDRTPTFEWSEVAGAEVYDLKVDDMTEPQSDVIRETAVAGTSFEPLPTEALTVGHTYEWWVRAGAGGVWGPWSSAGSFTVVPEAPDGMTPEGRVVASPTPLAEAGGGGGGCRPVFNWAAVEGATTYWLWVDDVTAGVSGVVMEKDLPENGVLSPEELEIGHTYRWWVRARAGEVWGAWSEAVSFTVVPAAPELLGPEGACCDLRPTFRWAAVAGATHYDVWVNDMTTWTTKVVRVPNVSGTSLVAPEDLVAGHVYRWWVRAGAGSAWGEWSAAMEFTAGCAEPAGVAPSIDSAMPDGEVTLAAGESEELEVYASDPGAGEALSYSWTVDGVTLEGESSSSLEYTAGAGDGGSHTVTVKVTDAAGNSASHSWKVSVGE